MNQTTKSPDLEQALASVRELGLDPEKILAKAARDERERRWLEENREAIEAQNAHFEEHGPLLPEYRQLP